MFGERLRLRFSWGRVADMHVDEDAKLGRVWS